MTRLVCCVLGALVVGGCGTPEKKDDATKYGKVPAYIASSACSGRAESACQSGTGCRWLALGAPCPSGATCPSGACVDVDSCQQPFTEFPVTASAFTTKSPLSRSIHTPGPESNSVPFLDLEALPLLS